MTSRKQNRTKQTVTSRTILQENNCTASLQKGWWKKKRRKRRGAALHPSPLAPSAGDCWWHRSLLISEDAKFSPSPFVERKAPSSVWSHRSCPSPGSPCGRNPVLSAMFTVWTADPSKISCKSDQGSENKHGKWHISSKPIPNVTTAPSEPCWWSVQASRSSSSAFSTQQEWDGAASKEGWSSQPWMELGQELRSLHRVIEKVNKSKQHLIYWWSKKDRLKWKT